MSVASPPRLSIERRVATGLGLALSLFVGLYLVLRRDIAGRRRRLSSERQFGAVSSGLSPALQKGST